MDPTLIPNYVAAAGALLGLPLDAARAARVAAHLQRTAAMAEMLEQAELAPHDEPAALYCPAPFPEADAAESLPGAAEATPAGGLGWPS